MPYRAAKISFDGSHYIAIPKENFPQGHKRRRPARPLSVEEVEKKELFELEKGPGYPETANSDSSFFSFRSFSSLLNFSRNT